MKKYPFISVIYFMKTNFLERISVEMFAGSQSIVRKVDERLETHAAFLTHLFNKTLISRHI